MIYRISIVLYRYKYNDDNNNNNNAHLYSAISQTTRLTALYNVIQTYIKIHANYIIRFTYHVVTI